MRFAEIQVTLKSNADSDGLVGRDIRLSAQHVMFLQESDEQVIVPQESDQNLAIHQEQVAGETHAKREDGEF